MKNSINDKIKQKTKVRHVTLRHVKWNEMKWNEVKKKNAELILN